MSYHKQKVTISINKEDELYHRLEAYAKRNNCTIDVVVDTLLMVGSYWLLDERLTLLERDEK